MLPPRRVVVHPARGASLRRLVRDWYPLLALFVIISAATVVNLRLQAVRAEEADAGTLVVTSSPAGAVVDVDGRSRGETPATIPLSPEAHRVTLRADGYAPTTYDVTTTTAQTTTLHADLWLASPRVQRLRPTFPGATVTHASFLADGRIVLSLTLQPGDEHQLWLLEPDGGARRLGPANVVGALAVSADGQQVAYRAKGRSDPSFSKRLDEVWVSAADGQGATRLYALPPDAQDESVVDLAWAPDGHALLIVARQSLTGGGGRTRLRWLDRATGALRDLVALPSDVVPGSYSWSPHGGSVAFLSRVEQTTSLCVLDTQSGELRYLADVGWDMSAPLPYPPLTWSPDGRRVLYSAPAQDRSAQVNWSFGAGSAAAIFDATLPGRGGRRLGEAEGQFPGWRPDGTVVALARAGSSQPLVARQVMLSGETQDVGEMALRVPASFAVQWDVAHAQAILVIEGAGNLGSGQPEYWLVSWRPEEAP